jgi:hypothetical protein
METAAGQANSRACRFAMHRGAAIFEKLLFQAFHLLAFFTGFAGLMGYIRLFNRFMGNGTGAFAFIQSDPLTATGQGQDSYKLL